MIGTDRRQRLILILNGVVLIVGGLDALQQHHYIVCVPSIVVGLLNMVAARFLARAPRFTAVALQLSSAFVAAFIALDAIHSGRHYLQYAWMLAAAGSLVAAAATFRRAETERT